MLDVVAAFDESVYFVVLCVDLFFEFALCFDELIVGGGEAASVVGGPCDGAAYCYSDESDEGRY